MAHRWMLQQLCGGSVEPNAAFHTELTRGDPMQTTTLHTNRVTRLIFSVALSVITLFAVSKPSLATGNVVPADLSGNWQMTIIGETGCGFGTTLYTFTLNASGVATNVSGVSHSACGTGNFSGDSFTIHSLSANGSGLANLTCGTGCGWNLNVQVAPDRSTFTVIDVSASNPGNFIQGVAIHQ
jgi:hypothetical protein